MQGIGNEFLTGPTFTIYQNRDFRSRQAADRFEYILHGRRITYQLGRFFLFVFVFYFR